MWTCPKCGEKIEDQFDSCWNCAGKQDASATNTWPFERILIVFIGLCVAIPLSIYFLHVIGYSRFCHRIAEADRAVVTVQGYPGNRTITADKVRKIVQAIGSAQRDRETYAAAFAYRTRFYRGTNYLGEVLICGDLFLFRGRQYHASWETLRALNVPPGMESIYGSPREEAAR